MFFSDILLAGCIINVQNIRKAAVSQHRTFVALKESTMYGSEIRILINSHQKEVCVRENLHLHLLKKST